MGSKRATTILGVPARLQALQEGAGLKSKAEFLRLVGIQKGQWDRYLKGEMPGQKVRERIAAATGYSAEWILTGEDVRAKTFITPQPRRQPPALREAIDLLSALHDRQRGGKWEWQLIMDQLRGSAHRANHKAQTRHRTA
jgi:transcriptional regulator with XRE-family HTH domain